MHELLKIEESCFIIYRQFICLGLDTKIMFLFMSNSHMLVLSSTKRARVKCTQCPCNCRETISCM